jgi:thiol-disulfide isomerase/thioredoxin
MRTIAFIIVILIILVSSVHGQREIPVVDFEGFESYLSKDNDTTYVVNFWATWCKPCVKELPAFEKLNEVYANDKVKVLLVSLDFIKHFETKVKPFVAEKNLKSDVILLNDPRSNQWIDKVSKEWSGAIPATVIYRGKDRLFYEGSFTYEELEKEMLKIHKP